MAVKHTHKEFVEVFNNLCGDQFELLSHFEGCNYPMTVKCKKCGKIKDYKNSGDIFRGRPCTCKCTKHSRKYTQKSFVEKVEKICPEIKVVGDYTVSTEKVLCYCIEDDTYFNAFPKQLYNRKGYPFTKGKKSKIVVGGNDLWSTNPEIAQYLKNPEDGYNYKYGVCTKLDFVCPVCKNIVSYMPSDLLNEYGKVKCKYCSDGVSYPEKYMNNLFNQLNVDWIWQYSKAKGCEWAQNYRYDFYIPIFNIIIEMHGAQHYTFKYKNHDLSYVKNNDKEKYELAIANNISDYIIINSSRSTPNWMKENILNSELSNYFDFSNIDWDRIACDSIQSYLSRVGNDWNNGMTIKDIAAKYQISRHTVSRYLKRCMGINYLTKDYNTN